MAEKILLSFSQYTISLEAGAACKSTISIHNRGSIVDQFTVSVEGLEESWYELSASSVKLFPGDQESIILTIHPPRDSTSKAGKYPFSVKATSVNDPSVTATELGTLEIQAFHEFAAELHPERREVGAEADFQVTLRNRGNFQETFKLSAQDQEDACQFRFENDVMKVSAGESERTGLYVMAKRRPAFGAKKQHTFIVNAVPEEDSDAAKKLTGQVIYKPMIPKWVLTIIVPVVLLLIIAVWKLWPVEKPVIEAFTVSPESITLGDSAVMRWEVQKARSIIIEPEPGDVQPYDSLFVSPLKSTEFTMTAKNRKGGKRQASVELTVIYPLPEIVSFTADRRHLKNPKQGAKLSWVVQGAEKIEIQPDIGDVDSVGSTTVFPERTTTYTLTATNPGGPVKKGFGVILATDAASFEKDISETEKKMKDYIATGKHLYGDKHLFGQAVDKFEASRQVYQEFRNKYGNDPKLDALDREARQWIDKVGSEKDRESAYKDTKQLLEEKLTAAKLFYQEGRFSEAQKDLLACSQSYQDFERRFGEDSVLKGLYAQSRQWIEKTQQGIDSLQATSVKKEAFNKAFDETKRVMANCVYLGKGWLDKDRYSLAIEEFEACRKAYRSFKAQFGTHSELEELDSGAKAGIEKARAELAQSEKQALEQVVTETRQAMEDHLMLGKGLHERGEYEDAIAQFEACREKYRSFVEQHGPHAELAALDKQAQDGIEKAKLAQEIEKRL